MHLAWSIPFVTLLLAIALMPFINRHWWERHFHHVAISLGAVAAAAYLIFYGGPATIDGHAVSNYGLHRMLEAIKEYFGFIVLIGSLFVVSGGILIDVEASGTPVVNTFILMFGAVLSNFFGTTGASMLLIRPYLRINKGSIRPYHVVFFIFVVSNVGGALTPIGDPPLFLGYMKGVPFMWTLERAWPMWGLALAVILSVFFLLETRRARSSGGRMMLGPEAEEGIRFRLLGIRNFFFLGMILLAVFITPESMAAFGLPHLPFMREVTMLLAAFLSYRYSPRRALQANEFTFAPIREVAWLFAGIFLAMVPALDYLQVNAAKMGVQSPGQFFWWVGALSSFLDNAPTYLSYLTTAFGLAGIHLAPANMQQFIEKAAIAVRDSSGQIVAQVECWKHLLAISVASVFFGANTYIGNGPNFMVKSIAEASGVETPGFFGYMFKYSIPILIPTYLAIWFVFFRT